MDSTPLAFTLAGFGLLLIAISYQRHRHHRDVSAILHGIAGVMLFAGGALLFELALNLHTYQDLQSDTPLAEISFSREGKKIQASLMRIPNGDLQVFTLTGSTWRMQARLMHWQRLMPWLGLTHQLRLELLQTDDARPPTAAATSYQLSHDTGINLWQWGESQDPARAWLRTEIIESPPMPLEDGQRFHIYLHDGQLQVRLINHADPDESRKPAATPVLNDKAVTLLKNSDLKISGVSHSEQSSTTTAAHSSHP